MIEFKKAVYSVLSGDSALIALTTIHDGAELNEPLPYIDISNVIDMDWSTKTFTGSEYSLKIHVWAETSSTVLQIVDKIKDLLHRQNLIVAGSNFVNMYHEDTDIFIDKDEITRHGVVSFRAKTHK